MEARDSNPGLAMPTCCSEPEPVVSDLYDHEHMCVRMHEPNHKGNVAEAAVAFHAARLGLQAFRPLQEHGRYDLVLEVGACLLRVQCKWAALCGDVVRIYIAGRQLTPRGYVGRLYVEDEIDAVAAYCADLDRCYLLPVALVAGKSMVHLRVSAAKNGQRAAVHWATDYEFPGAVAHLVERRHGMAEVARSTRVGSTASAANDDAIVCGAHEFRNHFGYYMELAEQGAEVTVTRHGKPCVRLVAAEPTSCSPGTDQRV